jgi:hypothetical protein
MHQAIAVLSVLFLAPLTVYITAAWARPFGLTITTHQVGQILSGTPYYPVQISFALFLGLSLGGWLQHRSMLWVWVIPFAVLCYFLAAFPGTSHSVLSQYSDLSLSSRLSHFFGSGCRVGDRCLDQIGVTLPFYGAAAYSVGAFVARSKTNTLSGYAEAMNQVRIGRALIPGGVSALYDLALNWRPFVAGIRRWDWLWVGSTLWALAQELLLVTYAFVVAISLLRRRFPVTRWFFASTE